MNKCNQEIERLRKDNNEELFSQASEKPSTRVTKGTLSKDLLERNNEIRELKEKVKNYDAEIAKLQADNAQLNDELNQLDESYKAKDQECVHANLKVVTLQEEIENLKASSHREPTKSLSDDSFIRTNISHIVEVVDSLAEILAYVCYLILFIFEFLTFYLFVCLATARDCCQ